MKTTNEQTKKAAAALGRLGGSVSSDAKTRAVRENAKKGGKAMQKAYIQDQLDYIQGEISRAKLGSVGLNSVTLFEAFFRVLCYLFAKLEKEKK